MTNIPWNVRLDSSVDPVCVVFAPRWFGARSLASAILDVSMLRIHVSQLSEREMREMLRVAPERELRMRAVDTAARRRLIEKGLVASLDIPLLCNTCGGTPPVSGLTCVCGGSGLQRDEIDGLRLTAFEYEKELEWLNDTERLEDVRWTMLNDGCGVREAITKLRALDRTDGPR